MSVLARYFLLAFVAFLRLDRHRGDRPRLEPRDRDRLAGHLAITVFAIADAADRRVDLGDQLALAIARAQFDRPVGLARRAIGEIGFAQRIGLKLGDRPLRFTQDRLLPRLKQVTEIILLRSAEHTSELQSLMRISYPVF